LTLNLTFNYLFLNTLFSKRVFKINLYNISL
jgi:hypothetical protein